MNDSIERMKARAREIEENSRRQRAEQELAAHNRAIKDHQRQQLQAQEKLLRETQRHNSAVEAGARGVPAGAVSSHPRGRVGRKLLFITIVIAAGVALWPRLQPQLGEAMRLQEVGPSVAPEARTEAAAESDVQPHWEAADIKAEVSANASVSAGTPSSSAPPTVYPPCSATVTDRCRQE